MKNIIILLLVSYNLYAQQTVKITYETIRTFPDSFFNKIPEDTRDEFKANFSKPYQNELITNGVISLFRSVNSKPINVQSTIEPTKTAVNMGLVMKPQNTWRRKNYTKNTITTLVEVKQKKFYVDKIVTNQKIYLAPGKLQIDKYNCNYAYALHSKNVADTIKYWYTSEIGIDDSPTNESGFPGLVLKVQSKNSVIYATKIEYMTDLVIEDFDPKIKFISIDEFEKLTTETMTPSTTIDSNGNKKVIVIQKMTE